MPVATGTTTEENLGWKWSANSCIGPLEPVREGEGRALRRTANHRLVVPTHPPRKVFEDFLRDTLIRHRRTGRERICLRRTALSCQFGAD